jgi:hypothetical protein
MFLVSLLLLVPCCFLYRFCYFFLAVAGWFIAVFRAPAVPDSTSFMASWLSLVPYCCWRPCSWSFLAVTNSPLLMASLL